jgi:hypothetical protein
MRLWDWIVLAAVAEGTLALVLALLVQRRTRGIPVQLSREAARSLVEDDPDEGDEEPPPRSLRKRQRPATRARSGELSVRVVPLSAAARDHYVRQWRHLRAEFVEEPGRTTERADQVVQDIMFDRGFPVADLEDDTLPVASEHQVVVENYRIAHRLAAGARRANTEQLRLAMLHFRVVLEELVADLPFDAFPAKPRPRRKRRSALPQPDVDRYRIAVTDQGPEPPDAPTDGRAVS